MTEFSDKVVLITGGSRGIGKAIAELFINENATVIVTYRNSIDNEYFNSKNIFHFKCDVADMKSVQDVTDGILKEHSKIMRSSNTFLKPIFMQTLLVAILT